MTHSIDSLTRSSRLSITIIETLYDFQINIRQSTIPNAGHGAYLTYLGARTLTKRASDRSTRLMKEHVIETEIATHNSLTAITQGGRSMNVTLNGKNLHYNDNNIYWTKKRSREYMQFAKKNGKEQQQPVGGIRSKSPSLSISRRSSMESFDESEVDCKVHDEVELLRNRIPEGNGIGFLGINQDSDYR